MMRAWLICMVCAWLWGAAAQAAAEPPHVGVLAGIGVRTLWGPGRYLVPYHPAEPAVRPAVVAAVAFPIAEHLAVGARAGAAYETYGDGSADCYRLLSTDLAVALQYAGTRFTVGPWLGRHISRFSSISPNRCGRDDYTARWSDDFTSYGVTAAVDMVARDELHLALFVDLQTATGNGTNHFMTSTDELNYRAITAGIAYRR
jgi:hypothetical protein